MKTVPNKRKGHFLLTFKVAEYIYVHVHVPLFEKQKKNSTLLALFVHVLVSMESLSMLLEVVIQYNL